MTDVSHFELLFKPQSPASPPSVNVDRVIQGYFLEITNLEAKEFLYRLDFVTVEPSPPQEFRSVAGNTLVFVDTPSVDNQPRSLIASGPAGNYIPSGGLIKIPPLATSLVAVLPSAFEKSPDPTPLKLPNFEVRGFVRISLPAVVSFPGPFIPKAQSLSPVRVLLTPQSRATFLDASNAITGQVQASLPLSGGTASIQIPPDPGGLIVTGTFDPSKLFGIAKLLQENPDFSQPEFLAAALGQLDSSPANLAKFNAALTAAGVKLNVNERQGGKTGTAKGD